MGAKKRGRKARTAYRRIALLRRAMSSLTAVASSSATALESMSRLVTKLKSFQLR